MYTWINYSKFSKVVGLHISAYIDINILEDHDFIFVPHFCDLESARGRLHHVYAKYSTNTVAGSRSPHLRLRKTTRTAVCFLLQHAPIVPVLKTKRNRCTWQVTVSPAPPEPVLCVLCVLCVVNVHCTQPLVLVTGRGPLPPPPTPANPASC
jgi:hypothetical protein